jgi:hypothetical protein
MAAAGKDRQRSSPVKSSSTSQHKQQQQQQQAIRGNASADLDAADLDDKSAAGVSDCALTCLLSCCVVFLFFVFWLRYLIRLITMNIPLFEYLFAPFIDVKHYSHSVCLFRLLPILFRISRQKKLAQICGRSCLRRAGSWKKECRAIGILRLLFLLPYLF